MAWCLIKHRNKFTLLRNFVDHTKLYAESLLRSWYSLSSSRNYPKFR